MIEVIAGLLLIGLIGVYFYFTQLRRAGRFRFEKGPCVGLLLGLAFNAKPVGREETGSTAFELFIGRCFVLFKLLRRLFPEMQLDRSQEEIENTTKRWS